MKYPSYIALAGFVTLLAIGQVFFKQAAVALHLERSVLGKLFLVPFCGAVSLYVVATVIWLCILRTASLSEAYPFVAISFALVPFFSWFVFNDQISARYIVGVALIFVGVMLTVSAR